MSRDLPCLLVLELGEAGGEPGPVARATNEEHRTRASAGRRRQDVVDSEVAIRGEWDTGHIRIALDEGSCCFTDQRGEDAGVRVRPDRVAARQQQAASVDLDTSIHLDLGRRSVITQIWPAGFTPRTMFRVTFGKLPSAFGVPATFETG